MEWGLSIGNRHSYLSAQPSQRNAFHLGYAVCSQRFGLSVLEGCRSYGERASNRAGNRH